ncbi:MAG TPA: dihydrolipoamide acetyltransferase family protein [Candidatus Dormibacteraeota bacterium]|jgi:pyruvate dehydrogenase E2 component (dihydrolipoamide acetyltransferase)
MSDVNMPKLSDTMEEGTVIEWKKKTGDAIKKGDVLAEVESDKASFELEADADGVLSIVIDAGKAVPVGDVIANIGKEGDAPAKAATKPEAEAEDKSETDAKAKPKPKPAEDEQVVSPAAEGEVEGPAVEPSEERSEEAAQARPAATGDGGDDGGSDGTRIKASPIAARLAAEMGVNLAELKGSGPDGRIIKEDVLAAAKQGGTGGRAAPQQRVAARSGPEVEHEELTRMQTIVARRMVESKTTVPHFYLTTEARMDEAVRIQKQIRETVTGAEKLTISDLVMRASALALRRFPGVNASWGGDHIEVKRRINIGFAVAQPKGLVVPVLKDVDAKDLVQISIESRQLIERARAGKPSPQDLEGGTFSISNLGMFGITEFAAVVNMPEAAILAIGAVTDRPVVENGQIVPGKLMKMTLSVDHRVLYGADGAQFLAEVKRLLENPVSLVLPPDQG